MAIDDAAVIDGRPEKRFGAYGKDAVVMSN
jgi:hypothetical protein